MALASAEPPQQLRPLSLHMGAPEWAALVLLSVIWGASFFFYRVMVTELPPMTIVFGRLAIGALALHLFLLAMGNPPRLPLRTWGRFALLGFVNNVIPFTLIAYSEVRISAGVAALLIGCVPVFSAIAAHVLTHDEKMTRTRVVGVIFGLAGVGILIGKDALQGLANADFVGELVCLSAAVVYALAGIYSRTFSGLPPLKVATGSVTMGALGVLPFMLVFDRPWELSLPSAPVLGSLLAIGLAGTAFAYILFFRLIARVGAMNISLVTLLQPVSAALLGWLFLSEAIGPNDFAGMAVIGLGLLFIDGRLPRLLTKNGRAGPV
jgi:drug/metabolite transporter (DMT)-like permease